ncbi:hypothetical protein DOTSEDRAFT_50987 [Dothistroma septosporum NZE10]|uniref:Uncharacterized protein n=1 Tax=Dothistroma septosporum (strain NZE10 / CBS 128990) TaxID=675120 RepID=N1PVX7_DOTSN|nr:hypothetical protein DOTSEDRAFT_50987 [Dothistroma septosporum NZE10]
MLHSQAMTNRKRPANQTPLGPTRPSPSSSLALDQQMVEPNNSRRQLKSVVTEFGFDETTTHQVNRPDLPTKHRCCGNARPSQIKHPQSPRGPDRWNPSPASLGGRLGERVDRQLADLESEFAKANLYVRWLESEMRARDATIVKLRRADHGDELKQERAVTKDLRAEVSKQNTELSVKKPELRGKQAKFDGKQRQLTTLMSTKENEVDQKLKALDRVSKLDQQAKKHAVIVELAGDLVESNTRGEWQNSGILMDHLIAAVEGREKLQPQAADDAIELTGEQEHRQYRVSLEPSTTNRFLGGD